MLFSTANDRDVLVSKLGDVYSAGNLNILIGAGASIGSGFPTWDALNHSLLEAYLKSVRDVGWDASLDSHVEEMSRTLGRDAIADFIWAGSGDGFWPLFSHIFYQTRSSNGVISDRQVHELPIRAVHRQLASMADRAKLFTANFDPLVEPAIAQRQGELEQDRGAWRKYRSPASLRQRLPENFQGPFVHHIHGWIDPPPPDGSAPDRHRYFVLTESHYIELATNDKAEPNQALSEIFAKDKVAFIVGMSLNDPNLRRLLYLLSRPANKDMGEVYAIVKSASKLGGRSDELFRDNLTKHWRGRGLAPIFVDEYDEIPTVLRDIQFGLPARRTDPPRWIEGSVAWVEKGLQPQGAACFGDAWQEMAFKALDVLSEQISRMYAEATWQNFGIEFFAPLRLNDSVARLYLLAESPARRASAGMEAREKAQRRALGIGRAAPQGVAGLAFVQGLQLEVLNRGPGYNYNFDEAMNKEWSDTFWHSILAVPVLDSRDFVPVAVVCVTSNETKQPFWRMEPANEPELYKRMRATAKYLLAGFRKEAGLGKDASNRPPNRVD
jgi:hypothetical protein